MNTGYVLEHSVYHYEFTELSRSKQTQLIGLETNDYLIDCGELDDRGLVFELWTRIDGDVTQHDFFFPVSCANKETLRYVESHPPLDELLTYMDFFFL